MCPSGKARTPLTLAQTVLSLRSLQTLCPLETLPPQIAKTPHHTGHITLAMPRAFTSCLAPMVQRWKTLPAGSTILCSQLLGPLDQHLVGGGVTPLAGTYCQSASSWRSGTKVSTGLAVPGRVPVSLACFTLASTFICPALPVGCVSSFPVSVCLLPL